MTAVFSLVGGFVLGVLAYLVCLLLKRFIEKQARHERRMNFVRMLTREELKHRQAVRDEIEQMTREEK